MQDLKLAFINFLTFTVSLSDVEQWLKLTLLGVSIAYTVIKIFKLNKNSE
jgi:hypothetical protein